MPRYDVIIIGAGASGLMCSAEAGKRGRKVLILDKAKNVGEKIRISGGGRCNFTNIHTSFNNFVSNNPRFCISALKRFTQRDFIALVEKHGIAYHEKTSGQLFCDKSSSQIVDMLIEECHVANVQIKMNKTISGISKNESGFSVNLDNEKFTCSSIVIATGGASLPKLGTTGWGYHIAKQFGIQVVPISPALVPLTFDGKNFQRFKDISGVSVDAVVSCNKKRFKEALLFTHKGLSGPVILQISSYWKKSDEITINLLPNRDVFTILKEKKTTEPKQELHKALSGLLPKRLAQAICEETNCNGRLADLSHKKLQQIANAIQHWQITPSGTEGFKTAEATSGGIDTEELSSKTFESKSVKGLYFIGEVIDVTGHLGGYNLQWAWSSGYAAGQYV
ncbi:MAG: NAD(P)/FAD-dependent oxidoreductase [Alphaproteobacteria bacterium]|nr:NAD(P)/FAD-dependent oxidoreductase [Alphaproteobacteria bacterium]